MSLDKVESSNPNLTAAHAGASTRKTGHLQPNASNAADAEEGCFAFSRLLPTFEYSPSRGKSPLACTFCRLQPRLWSVMWRRKPTTRSSLKACNRSLRQPPQQASTTTTRLARIGKLTDGECSPGNCLRPKHRGVSWRPICCNRSAIRPLWPQR